MIVNIGIHGASGKMGKAIAELIAGKPDLYHLAAQFDRKNKHESLEKLCHLSRVIVDFSSPDGLAALLKALLKSLPKKDLPKNLPKNLLRETAGNKTRLLIGTTGFGKEQDDLITKLITKVAKEVAVLIAPNTSIGANLVAALAVQSYPSLIDYDIEILEAHHRDKKDAPSGTALMIGEQIAQVGKFSLAEKAVFDRHHNNAPRKKGEIGFCSLRGGGIFGEHSIIFAGENEIIRIEHQVISRKAFAEGALLAARWLADKPAGIYTMSDVLNSG